MEESHNGIAPVSKTGTPRKGFAGSSPVSSAMFNFFKTCLLVGRKQKTPENLKEILGQLNKLTDGQKEISRELADFKKESKKNLQKIGIVRFNPFKEIGGDQSFSIAVLDDNNNGFVITSHYNKESNRVYAKPVELGKSKYQLSKEEEDAINRAINI